MPQGRRAPIRLWQTELFIVVIVVAMLILSGSLSAGLETTLTRIAEDNEIRKVAGFARRLEPEFPLDETTTQHVRGLLAEYRVTYGGGIWVYDDDGLLIDSTYDVAPADNLLGSALAAGLAENPAYVRTDFRHNGWVVASRAVYTRDGSVAGVVVTTSPVDEPLRILDAVRSRLWVTFWVSLGAAGLLGFVFSELIARRIRAMSEAAAAMAAGDFNQRLETGFVPDEIRDLANSYNSMAARLGEAFGAIQESQRQIAAVVESMAEGVVAVDSDGVVHVINPEAIRLLGLPDGDFLGVPAEQLTDDPTVLEMVHCSLEGHSAIKTVTLGQFRVQIHSTPLIDPESDSADGSVLLLSDVTERHKLEESQRRFVADASHEMRTPIAALKGMLELLADGAKDVPEVRDDFINTMQVEADRLGRLVADLLTLAQLEAGSLRLKVAPQVPAELLGEVARVLSTIAEQSQVQLLVEVTDIDAQVMADHDKAVQVLLSFTDNALKHSPPGSTVRLRAEKTADAVRFSVSDEGPGIEAEQLARVFERFYRADEARAGGKGTGLGLAIAKEIVEGHGSTIEVESAPGRGTRFAFELPLA